MDRGQTNGAIALWVTAIATVVAAGAAIFAVITAMNANDQSGDAIEQARRANQIAEESLSLQRNDAEAIGLTVAVRSLEFGRPNQRSIRLFWSVELVNTGEVPLNDCFAHFRLRNSMGAALSAGPIRHTTPPAAPPGERVQVATDAQWQIAETPRAKILTVELWYLCPGRSVQSEHFVFRGKRGGAMALVEAFRSCGHDDIRLPKAAPRTWSVKDSCTPL